MVESSDDKFDKTTSTVIDQVEEKKEMLDQKEIIGSPFKECSYIEYETRTFKSEVDELSDRNIDKKFDVDVIELCAIKKEIVDVNAVTKGLTDCYRSSFKSETIEQEEIHIKQEEVTLNEKTQKPGNQLVLHHCAECPYKTLHKRYLKSHLVKHKKLDEVGSFICQKCPYKTQQKRNLKLHAEVHNNLMLKCSECSYETLKSSKLKKHQIEHKTNINWLHCPKCSFKTHQPCRLQKHLLAHKSDAFKCVNCSYQARTKSQITVHQVKHESMDKWLSCPLCPFKSHAKNLLEAHCRRRHNTNPSNPKQIEILKCPKCPYVNGCKQNMKRHELLVHDQSKWFQCPDCAYKTPHKYILKQHRLRHQGEKADGWHRCLECSYKATSKGQLQNHVILHKSLDEIRWFECSQCSFKSMGKRGLTRHQLVHKQGQEVEWFCCYECTFKTKRRASLVRHISRHKSTIKSDDDTEGPNSLEGTNKEIYTI